MRPATDRIELLRDVSTLKAKKSPMATSQRTASHMDADLDMR